MLYAEDLAQIPPQIQFGCMPVELTNEPNLFLNAATRTSYIIQHTRRAMIIPGVAGSGVATLGHAGARAPATYICALAISLHSPG